MKHFNNEKGFTVIELILSFALVMFLAIAMFAVVNSYRNREQKESVARDLLTLKTKLTQDINEDMMNKKVKKIEYCRDTSDKDEDGDNTEIIIQCINIYFHDDSQKQLKVDFEEIVDKSIQGTNFTYETFNVIYGTVKYENPSPKFATIVNDYILTYTTDEDNLEYGTLYKIKIRIDHQDLDDEVVIEVVTTGTE